MIEMLATQLKTLEESLAEATSLHEEAARRKTKAEEATVTAREEYSAAERAEADAAEALARLSSAISAIRNQRPRRLNGSKTDLSDLLQLTERVLRETPAGCDAETIQSAIRERFEGKRRGLHKRIHRLLETLQDDPRFHFDGDIFTLNHPDMPTRSSGT